MNDLSSIRENQLTTNNYMAQGFAGINSAIANATSTLGYNMLQGFNGVERGLCTLGYNVQSGFNTLGHQISDCLKKFLLAIKNTFTKTVGSLV